MLHFIKLLQPTYLPHFIINHHIAHYCHLVEAKGELLMPAARDPSAGPGIARLV